MNQLPIASIAFLVIAINLKIAASIAGENADVRPEKNQFDINHYLLTLKGKKMTTDTTINMFTTRIFDAPLEKVWKSWSTEEMVKQWWGPKGFTCPVARIIFQEGKTSFVCMRAPKEFGGRDMYNTWTYQKIVPMGRIEYILNFTDKDGNKGDPSAMGMPSGIPKEVPHLVTFKDLGNGKTEVTVTEYGYTNAEVVALSKAGMNQCLDKMAEALAKH